MINSRKKLYNECLICAIHQLRHFDGCAIKLQLDVRFECLSDSPPSPKQFIKSEDKIETRLQMEKLYFLLLGHYSICSPYRNSRIETAIRKGEIKTLYKAFSCFSFLFSVNYHLMIVKNFINAIKVFVRVSAFPTRDGEM